ncbi:MAG: ABC transporter permease subunit [Clostridia bacterium]|nr:ABC transporter permease subunit [Clostridia bacterium]
MRSFVAFLKKEFMEGGRTFKIVGIIAVFVILAVMNTLTAKFTPLLMELLEGELAQAGISFNAEYEVKTIDSWIQFYKNMPMGLIAFVLIFGGTMTKEYDKGSMILLLTKGFARYKVILAKLFLLVLVWSVGYWLSFGITVGLNSFLLESVELYNFIFAALCWYIFGIFVIALIMLFSVIFKSYGMVLLGTGGVVAALYLISIAPSIAKWLPIILISGVGFMSESVDVSEYLGALIICAIASVGAIVASIPIFNKKQI